MTAPLATGDRVYIHAPGSSTNHGRHGTVTDAGAGAINVLLDGDKDPWLFGASVVKPLTAPVGKWLTVAWRRPDPDDERPTVPFSWSGWGHLYARRWQYWPPWGVTEWWRLQAIDACDGQRASKLIILPPLGALVWFTGRPCGHDDEDGPQ